MADGIPARLAALANNWEWVSGAPSRVETLTNTISSLNSRLEKIDDDNVNKNVLTLVETNEKTLPELEDKLEDGEDTLENTRTAFEKTGSELSRRVDAIKSTVG
jgi:chaperonin cofactor prefoldin